MIIIFQVTSISGKKLISLKCFLLLFSLSKSRALIYCKTKLCRMSNTECFQDIDAIEFEMYRLDFHNAGSFFHVPDS